MPFVSLLQATLAHRSIKGIDIEVKVVVIPANQDRVKLNVFGGLAISSEPPAGK